MPRDQPIRLGLAATSLQAIAPALTSGDFEVFRQQSMLLSKPDGAHIVLTDTSGRCSTGQNTGA